MQPGYNSWDLTRSAERTSARARTIRNAYFLLLLAVAGGFAGGSYGMTQEWLIRLFTGWMGWILGLLILNAVPMLAMRFRDAGALGAAMLFVNGFLSGIVLSPMLFIASRIAPDALPSAVWLTLGTGAVATAYVVAFGVRFKRSVGLTVGFFAATMGVIVLNQFLHMEWLSLLIGAAVAGIGVYGLLTTTSALWHEDHLDPVGAALMLFAGCFNTFVGILSLLMRLRR